MAGEAQISFTGNLTTEPELRFTPSGSAVCNFTVAVNPRVKNSSGGWDDGDPAFYRCAAWGSFAENCAESLGRGTRVVVVGRLAPRTYEHEGSQRMSLDVNVDSVGADLRFATVQVQRVDRSTGGGQQSGGGWGGQQAAPQQSQGWGQQPQGPAPGWGQPQAAPQGPPQGTPGGDPWQTPPPQGPPQGGTPQGPPPGAPQAPPEPPY